MPFTHDVCFGQATNDPQKKHWIKCGGVFTNEKGQISIKLDVLPLGIDPTKGLWLSVFDKKEKGSPSSQEARNSDEVPF